MKKPVRACTNLIGMIKLYLLTLSLLYFPLCLNAQDTTQSSLPTSLKCATFVKDLEQEFNSGHYDECFIMLNNGMNCEPSKREKEDLWLIAVQLNLERDNIPEVHKSFVKLLKNNPLYTPKEGAFRSDFYTHFKTIRVRPLLLAGLRSGLNVPNYKVTNIYSIADSVNYSASYQAVPGYQVGVYIEYQVLNNITLLSELDYSSSNYKRFLSGQGGRYFLDYSETLKFFDMHFNIKKYFGNGRLKPYVLGGVCLNMLQKATAQVNVKYTRTDPFTKDIDHFSSEKTVDQTLMRTSKPNYVSLGFGCGYGMKRFVFGAEARLMNGLTNIMNPEKRLNNSDMLYNFYYIDNDVMLRKMEFSVSVAYIFKYSVREGKHDK